MSIPMKIPFIQIVYRLAMKTALYTLTRFRQHSLVIGGGKFERGGWMEVLAHRPPRLGAAAAACEPGRRGLHQAAKETHISPRSEIDSQECTSFLRCHRRRHSHDFPPRRQRHRHHRCCCCCCVNLRVVSN